MSEREDILRSLLGDEMLDYLFGVTDEYGRVIRERGEHPDDEDLTTLFTAVEDALPNRPGAVAFFLGTLDEQQGTTRANVIRAAHGGQVPDVREADTLTGALVTLARDLFPIALLRDDNDRSAEYALGPGLGWVPLHMHPQNRVATEALGRDTRLASATGEPWGILYAAHRYLQLDDGPPSVLGLMDSVRRCVADVQRAASGEPVLAPTLLAFDGLRLPSSVTVSTPWGSLRSARGIEEKVRVLGPRAHGRRATAVLAVDEPIEIAPDDDPDSPGELRRASPPSYTPASLIVPLAALLGVRSGPHIAPAMVWREDLYPAMSSSGISGSIDQRWGATRASSSSMRLEI